MKKNRMTRLLAILMMLAMVAGALTGCFGEGNETKDDPAAQSGDEGNGKTEPGKNDPPPVVKTDADLIIGRWEAQIDLEDAFAQGLGESEGAELFADLDFSGIYMEMDMEFRDDGTLNMEVDRASVEAAMNTLVDRIVEAFPEIIRSEIAKQAGVDVSEVTDEVLDLVLEQMGMESWDDVGEMLRSQIDLDDMFEDTEFHGYYLVKDGTLYTNQYDEATEDDEPMRYELDGDTLVLHPEDNNDDLPAFMYNLTFRRVG